MSEEYNNYLNEHIRNVKTCTELMKLNGTSLLQFHDESKRNYREYDAYDNWFYGEKTDEAKREFDLAWLHHIHNNPHHWNHWVLVEGKDNFKILDMPDEYIYEMVADWGSFALKAGRGQDLLDWYESHKDKMLLSDKTRKTVELLVPYLAKQIDLYAAYKTAQAESYKSVEKKIRITNEEKGDDEYGNS